MSNRSGEFEYVRELPVPLIVVEAVLDEAGEPVDLVYERVNEMAADIEGAPADALEGRSFFDVHPGARRDLIGILAETALTGAKQHFSLCDPTTERFFSISTYRPAAGRCACLTQDVTEQARLERAIKEEYSRLERQATRDPLTGLLHVAQGRRLVEEALAQPPRWPGAKGVLFMFDVDDFKKVNDEHGHHCGDMVLKEFAELLERSFRRSDIVFRAGGDEFSAFIADVPCACVATRICDDVIAGVEQLSRRCVEVSVSVGVAFGSTERSLEEFYCAADRALYGIKRTGKSSYRICDLDDPASCDVLGPSFKRASLPACSAAPSPVESVEGPVKTPAA
ncbi:sensor domain-containing diguanylate cyclase [Arabiibacter massiliensis]|uniref:sensor domain-containing diguanylate cyclase n=1 Tax=Arabiibacter massiliensis TaxID=1870985 RepID=UPI0009B9A1A2|nr:sensor domain-containing diguanylate cyclase [Arabiibacter massiliensis]